MGCKGRAEKADIEEAARSEVGKRRAEMEARLDEGVSTDVEELDQKMDDLNGEMLTAYEAYVDGRNPGFPERQKQITEEIEILKEKRRTALQLKNMADDEIYAIREFMRATNDGLTRDAAVKVIESVTAGETPEIVFKGME